MSEFGDGRAMSAISLVGGDGRPKGGASSVHAAVLAPIRVVPAHSGAVVSVAMGNSGLYAATGGGSDDPTVVTWRLSTGTSVWKAKGHTDSVWALSFTRDDQYLASGSYDQTVRIWQVSDGSCLRTLKKNLTGVWGLCFSDNGSLLASCTTDRLIQIWSTSNWKAKILKGHLDTVYAVVFAPGNAILASASKDCQIRLWNVADGSTKAVLRGHSNPVTSLAFSPDGMYLASGSLGRSIRLWNLRTNACERIFAGHTMGVRSVAFTSDGAYIVSGSLDRTLRVWSVADASCPFILPGHTGWVNSIGITKDAKLIVSVSHDRTMRIWSFPFSELVTRRRQSMESRGVGPEASRAMSVEGLHKMAGRGDEEMYREVQALRRKIEEWDVRWMHSTQEREKLVESVRELTVSLEHASSQLERERETRVSFEDECAVLGRTTEDMRIELAQEHSIRKRLETSLHALEEELEWRRRQLDAAMKMLRAHEAEKVGKQDTSEVVVLMRIARKDIRVGSFVGRGAFGCVYEGLWGKLKVGLKIIRFDTEFRMSAAEIEEILKPWASLEHSNLLPLLGILDEGANGDVFGPEHLVIVTPWVQFGSLRSYLRTSKEGRLPPMSWPLRWKIARDVACALAHLHSKGMVHGALTSENVLLDLETGEESIVVVSESDDPFGGSHPLDLRIEVKLADFDLQAFRRVGQTKNAVLLGHSTLRYSAPEIVLGDDKSPVKKESDVFSFGMILLELATGRIPYSDEESERAVCVSIARGHFDHLPATISNEVPTFAGIVTACCANEPQDRPSMDDVVSMIEGATGDVSRVLRSVSQDEIDAKTVSSHSTTLSAPVSGVAPEFGGGGERHSFDGVGGPVDDSFSEAVSGGGHDE
eukprot:TRINITY_DN15567_c0_g1_i1.p1 TRINITY_DN15567_c0_g1~~TRINITY_DN15567_c0_g1_i1.p1  ORF type:complete len:873 (+),score=228.74 TRINITY_DN15567_c0_g1_i1:108-2726(+)